MSESTRRKTKSQPQLDQKVYTARRLFFPAPREPVQLPQRKIEIPVPAQAPPAPPTLNWWTTILPPMLMLIGAIAGALISAQSLLIMIPMFVMSLGFPIANLFGLHSQRRAYQQQLHHREQAYRQKLAEIRQQLETLARQQRQALDEAYPSLKELHQIAQAADKRLWTRRPVDADFLALRIGTGEGLPSFVVEPPRYVNLEDTLVAEGAALASEFQKLENLPYLLSLASTGSLAIGGKSTAIYPLARRLILDLLVHHSPQDIQLIVLADTREAMAEWEWLKWAPHTDALNPEKRVSFMAFDPAAIERTMEFVMEEYHRRRSQGQEWQASGRKVGGQTAFVLLVDDSGTLRQRTDMRTLAEWGHEVSIYPIFIGGRDWPRECQARLDAVDDSHFRFVKTGSSTGEPQIGMYESASIQDCEHIVRALAGWIVSKGETRIPLPESVRLSRVLGVDALSPEAIQHAWSAHFEPEDLLQFPIGIYARRDRLDLAVLNLLPAAYGGKDAYHTILIGTTGSGKSEFMKSLVFGAAVRYPPSILNFFFMDFKGGAAFNIFSELPHVSGIVTNLSPELVERGLDSIRNEIERRQSEFAAADPANKRIQNIWDYNRANPDHPMPHLILFLDEFARGLSDFPRLRETLDVLVRQGRSLGMYLILANQDVNSEVDKLLNNVGWRIALKVAKPEEMHIIDRFLPSPVRAGQGYLRLSSGGSEIIEFQAGYGGFPAQTESASSQGEGFCIYEVEADGTYREVWRERIAPTAAASEASAPRTLLKEEELILRNIRQAAEALQVKPAKRIYLDPLPAIIPLDQVLEEAGVQRAFQEKKWQRSEDLLHVVAHWGKLDLPEQCLQETLALDFDEKDGHLWMVGAPKSGLDMALGSLLFSLALRYTPEQVQFYLLELGAGELVQFELLPHTGALISPQRDSPQENERLNRLLNLLEREMQERAQRTRTKKGAPILPALFVVINSFAELRANFPDEVERLTRFVRDGSRLGIHFIITAARGPELTRSIAGMIARRLVLQLANKDDYVDVVGKLVPPLTQNIPGRGYWVDDGIALVQVASPPPNLEEQIQAMRKAWKGRLPQPVQILPSTIALTELLKENKPAKGEVRLPVGIAYETLQMVVPSLYENPFWLILGPRESGKSNFLASAARSLLEQDASRAWTIRAYALRRSPLTSLLEKFPTVIVQNTAEGIIRDLQELTALLKESRTPEGKSLLLLIDDLGFAFQPGRETLAQALNALGAALETAHGVVLMASGLLEELRMQLASPLVKLLRQNRTGVVLSKDTNEADWLGASIPLEYRRMDLPLGRGFFIHKGRLQLVQTPRWDL